MGRSRSRRRRHHHRQSAYSTKFSQQPLPEAAAGVRGLQQTLPSPYPTRQSSGLWLRFRLKLRRHLRASDQREEPPSMPCSRLNKKAEMGIITHVAVCTSGDWVKIDKIVLGNCVIASQAQRKWHPNVICNVSSGYCRHGANSANITVENRMTGQLKEEQMQVYLRLGIRMLFEVVEIQHVMM